MTRDYNHNKEIRANLHALEVSIGDQNLDEEVVLDSLLAARMAYTGDSLSWPARHATLLSLRESIRAQFKPGRTPEYFEGWITLSKELLAKCGSLEEMPQETRMMWDLATLRHMDVASSWERRATSLLALGIGIGEAPC